jgi:hypothetical protein
LFEKKELFEEELPLESGGKTNIMEKMPEGIPIKVNIQTLLKRIVISPNANKYFHKPLIKLMKENDLDPGIVSLSKI